MSEMKHCADTSAPQRFGQEILPCDGGYLIRQGAERGGAYMVDIETSDEDVQEVFFTSLDEATKLFEKLAKAAHLIWAKKGLVNADDLSIEDVESALEKYDPDSSRSR